ncbi:WD40-repeat-containing domain protein [Phycomyces nitens]|nr:WD40-repeat-containing domain protein [Phycomyces nitens]
MSNETEAEAGSLAPLKFNQAVFHFATHPSEPIIASGLINGKIQCHAYGEESHKELWTEKAFKKSCRGVAFNPDGSQLYSVSKDKTILLMDTMTGQTIKSREMTHENPLNSLLCLNENMFATGDDQGVIKIWDNRKEDAVMTYSEHEDFIADMAYSASHKTLVAVGGDGYLSTWDIRKPNVAAMSDQMGDELLSVRLVKNGRKAVVGSQEGILSLWSWGDWGDYKDRIVGHPHSIDAICKIDEDTICTGSSDGMIRVVSILPNAFHGVIGDHGQDMPIEHIELTHDKKYLISCGHDESLRFWNVGYLFDEDEEEEEENDKDHHSDEEDVSEITKEDKDSEEEDDSDAEEEKALAEIEDIKDDKDDSDDSDDSEDEKPNKKRQKMQMKKEQKKKEAEHKKKSSRPSTFFSDL